MTTIELLGTFLWNAAWKGTLVGAGVLVARPLARSLPARQRHLLSIVALFLCLGLPLAAIPRFVPAPPTTALASTVVRATGTPEGVVGISLPILATVEALYALFLAVRLSRFLRALGVTRALRLSAREQELPHPVAEGLERCRRELGGTAPPVLWSTTVPVPVTLGVLSPVVILPVRSQENESPHFWTAVLGHELAHVRRNDFAWNLVLQLVSTPVAFHPVVRWLLREIHLTREQACDELVSTRILDARRYSNALLTVAGSLSHPDRIACSMGASDGSSVEVRIMNLLTEKKRSKLGALRLASIGAILVAAGVSFPAMAVEVVAASSSTPYAAAVTPETARVAVEENAAASHSYNSKGRRDPFVSPEAKVAEIHLEGTAGFEIEAVELSGIVSTSAGFTAMISGPDRKTYFVRVGEHFYNGTLVGIAPDALTFEVQDPNPLVASPSRNVVLPLHPGGNSGSSGN